VSRKPLSKRTRFEVFKRDEFTCQYCGGHPPAAILHVDHIVAVANGGGNDDDNLITSCSDCNLGKSAVPLSSVPQSLKDKGAEVAEREAQIRGYHEIMQARAERIEADAWDVVHHLVPGADSFDSRNFVTIKRFVERLGSTSVQEAADLAYSRIRRSEYQRFRYFCGICWKWIRSADERGN